jgi:multidrug efflux pump subunit AcrA (membrane-fusion protein)
MKQKIISFFQKPVQVTIASVVIALVIGVAGYMRIHTTPAYQFVKAAPGTILGSNTSGNLTLGFLAGGRIKTVAVKTGDTVKAGDILATLDAGNASGALTQAKAAYATAQANYQKVISGATGSTIDVAKAAVNTAQVNFDQVTKQQQLAVANANRTLLNSTLAAQPTGTNSTTSKMHREQSLLPSTKSVPADSLLCQVLYQVLALSVLLLQNQLLTLVSLFNFLKRLSIVILEHSGQSICQTLVQQIT